MNEYNPRTATRASINALEAERREAFDGLFCDAARVQSTEVCSRCDSVTLAGEADTFGEYALCEVCAAKFHEHVCDLPQFVTDADLPVFLPIFAGCFARNTRKESGV